ncbi:PRP38 family-domain-containing protein [Plectosphaerella plurivora]|uniref:Pre-mRNA-splicing factor 38 n=1 Tax=Plectosphaerella plurivora TaxID=936078 RepID=A0A9P8V9I4_9PEZI|nr:PRP38 family-domain-containing protein [Plectosphaerella plurivora]
MGKPDPSIIQADERRFLDERGSGAALAPNGENPAKIMEKAVVDRIVDSFYWKEQCFALNEASLVDRVVEHVTFIGGTYGNAQKPTPFICLALKLLQLAPSPAVIDEYLSYGGERFKYLRALGLLYVRMTQKPVDVYRTLEPFLVDRRKLRRKARSGTSLTYIDEFVDELLTQTRVCGTSFRELPRRTDLVDLGELEERESPLGDIDELLDAEEEEEQKRKENGDGSEGEVSEEDRMEVDAPRRDQSKSRSRSRSPTRSRSPPRRDDRSRSRDRSP